MNVKQRLLVRSSIELIGENVNEVSRLFYRELFHLDINFRRVFHGDVVFLNRKFANMMATFKSLEYLEKIRASIEKLGERHVLNYGVQIEHFVTSRRALMYALSEYLGENFTAEMAEAWNCVFSEVEEIMKAAMVKIDRRKEKRTTSNEARDGTDLLFEIGGETTIINVHQRFYDVMFDHPWLGQFFYGKPKVTLILKQTQFMLAAFGGPNNYQGDTPAFVHMHMFITDEAADLRQKILRKAIIDEGLSADIAARWLKIDDVFREGITKNSIDECIMKCLGQVPITAKKPAVYIPEL